MADDRPIETDPTEGQPALPVAYCVRCAQHVVTYRLVAAASPGEDGAERLVHHCLLCDATLAVEPAGGDAGDDVAAGTAYLPYGEVVALGFGYPEDLPEPEEGGCGSCSSGGCGTEGGAAKGGARAGRGGKA